MIKSYSTFPSLSWWLTISLLLISDATYRPLICTVGSSHLSQFDQAASSSSFGEPIFRLEPPSVIKYSNLNGATIHCLASGSPKPTISWYTSSYDTTEQTNLGGATFQEIIQLSPSNQQQQTQLVTNVPDLRQISSNGATLTLLPFKQSDFRQEIHSTEYRCVASNYLATIHSRSVQTQAALKADSVKLMPPDNNLSKQQPQVRVNDEFVELNSPAVLKCRPTGALANYLATTTANVLDSPQELEPLSGLQLVEWFTSDNIQIQPNELNAQRIKGNKLVAFKSGELHVSSVELADLQRTYGCRLRLKPEATTTTTTTTATTASTNGISHLEYSSSGLAKLVLTESESQAPTQQLVLHSVNQLIALDSRTQLRLLQEEQSGRQTNAGNSFISPPPSSSSSPFAHHQHSAYSLLESQQQTLLSAEARLLLLPCAVRNKPAPPQQQQQISGPGRLQTGAWFYQSTSTTSATPIPIEQWAAHRSMGVPVYLSAGNGSSGGQTSNGRTILGSDSSGTQARSLNRTTPTFFSPRFIVGATFLAIEWPERALSGRYIYATTTTTNNNNNGQQQSPELDRTMCDINVLVNEPIALKVELAATSDLSAAAGAAASAQLIPDSPDWWPEKLDFQGQQSGSTGPTNNQQQWSFLSRAVDWLSPKGRALAREQQQDGRRGNQRQQPEITQSAQQQQQQPLLDEDPFRIQLRRRSAALIEPPPLIRVGARLELNCLALAGEPIESLKWFKNGQAINTQSSSDFQTEIRPQTWRRDQVATPTSGSTTNKLREEEPRALSSLIIRQVQAKDVGFQLFECFASNSLGDRARAGLAVFVVSSQMIEQARSQCPTLSTTTGGRGNRPAIEQNQNETTNWLWAEPYDNQQPQAEEQEAQWGLGGTNGYQLSESIFSRHNPFKRALVLELEPVELVCPLGFLRPPHQGSVDQESLLLSSSNGSNWISPRLEWRRWTAQQQQQQQQLAAAKETANKPSGELAQSRNFNQLFSGDSRFVINGSSLQIRSPSKRHDDAIYACRLLAGEKKQQQLDVHQSSFAWWSANLGAGGVGSCSNTLAALIFDSEQQAQDSLPLVSSISIKVVGKPKIDPFEFSRNLEEGMRSVLVCAVVSGQSPVDIIWFKDWQLLNAQTTTNYDNQLNVDQTNGFSSTLTFHRIQPKHSGVYTCVASNAFGSANHSSRLTVNVAPYFIDPPKNTQALLNSNVLVNCRAGGEPNPQIRWRKLVPIGQSNGVGKLLAPSSGQSYNLKSSSLSGDPFGGDGLSSNQEFYQPQMAPPPSSENTKYEFRVITSNSHIQILENGSMIIKDLELSDESRYICQAFNGLNPSLSEMIQLTVLSPPQFELNYETVSVKRDSMIKFNCAPKGDQPMRIEWRKESSLLVANELTTTTTTKTGQQQQQQSKYSEIVHFATPTSINGTEQQPRLRHNNLMIVQQTEDKSGNTTGSGLEPLKDNYSGMRSSELLISYADRADSGSFVCIARNSYGKDELNYRLLVQEPPDTPTKLVAQNVQSSSLKLSWMAAFDGNLPLSHFVVEYKKAHTSGGGTPMSSNGHSEWSRLIVSTSKHTGAAATATPGGVNSPQLMIPADTLMSDSSGGAKSGNSGYSILLRQLSPRTTYHIRVAAANALGQSSYSAHLTITSAEEPPNQRANDVRTQPISSGSIRLLWRGPALVDEQAPIKGYYISHRKMALSASPSSMESSNSSPKNTWISTYSVSVTNSTPTDADNYPIFGQSPAGIAQNQHANPTTGLSSSTNYEFLLNSLEKNTKYEIRVQPYNSMGVGPASEVVGQTLKFDRPAQPNLELIAVRRQSLELKWNLNDDQPLMGFSIFYKCEYDDWQEIQLGVIYHYVVEQLRCGNKYQIYLSAFNVVGRSEPSNVLSVRTEGTVPIAPDKTEFIQSNISEIVLDMSGWQSGGCPISSFMVQFKRLQESNWFILSEGATPFANSDKITIPDLAPATWYKLLVTALNEAGSTNAEYLFSTLTLDGNQIAPIYTGAESNFETSGLASTGWLMGGSGGTLGRGGGRSVWSWLAQLFALQPQQQQTNSSQLISELPLMMSSFLLLLIVSLGLYLYYYKQQRTNGGHSHSNHIHHPSHHRNNNGSTIDAQLNCANSLSRSSSQMALKCNGAQPQQHHLTAVGCTESDAAAAAAAVGATLARTAHLIASANHQQAGGAYAANNNHLLSSAADNQQPSVLLDSLMGMQSINNSSSPRTLNMQRQQHHAMKLLSGAGSSNCTSSSMSTHSTNCFEPCSSSSSLIATAPSSGGGGGGAKAAKLQLIDESSLILSSGTEQQQQQQQPPDGAEGGAHQQFQYLYGAGNQSSTVDQQSPMRTIGRGYGLEHVELVSANGNQQQSNCEQTPDSSDLLSRHLIDVGAANFGNFLINKEQQQQHSMSNRIYNLNNQRLISSSSFASSADLMQRQQFQYQQEQYNEQQQAQSSNEEPIYQRLDKFQTYGPNGAQFMPPIICKQPQHQYNQTKSQTLRFNNHFPQEEPLVATNKSMTLHRGAIYQQQQQQQQLEYSPGYCVQNQRTNSFQSDQNYANGEQTSVVAPTANLFAPHQCQLEENDRLS